MSYEIKQLSHEEQDAIRNQYYLMPADAAKEFQVLDDGLSLSFFDTREEAEADMRRWESLDRIQSMIDYRLPVLIHDLEAEGSQYGIDSDEIRKMLKESV